MRDYTHVMALELKLRKIGNSVGVILPKEALSHLKIEEGDTVSLTETPDGYRLSQSQSDFAKTMAVMESLSKRYRNTLRELAK
jgi:putative addiction module antidote